MHQPAIQHTRLPFRDRPDGSIEIMVITSCGTLRWVTPKGWPMKEEKSHGSAAREALKEARSVGKVGKAPNGTYRYGTQLKNGEVVACQGEVFPLR